MILRALIGLAAGVATGGLYAFGMRLAGGT